MGRLRWIAAFAAVAVAMCGAAGRADKVAVDPNTPAAQARAVPKDEADPRMAVKITYDSGYKRLHAVIEDLSRLGGVSIACGQSAKDWRVRDIPVVVCVTDMPLGKVLHAVTEATHTWVVTYRTGNDNSAKGYRVCRRQKEEAEIDSLLQSRHDAKMARVNWQWDAMMAYGKSPELTKFNDHYAIFGKLLWPVAKLMATLGPDARDRMLSGEAFRFYGADAATKEVMNDLYQIAWHDMLEGMREEGKTAPPPTAQDAEGSELTIKLMDTGDSGETEIQVNLSPMVFGRAESGWITELSRAQALCGTDLKLPDYPKDTQTPSLLDDLGDPSMARVSRNKRSSMDYRLLKATIDVEKPKDLKNPTFADFIRALAKGSGCNMVVEDFLSQMDYRHQQMDRMFAKSTSIADRFQYPLSGRVIDYAWFFNEGEKLLVGWADDQHDRTWRDHHRNLVSEEYLQGLKDKLDGAGLDLDDVVPLMTMPSRSFEEWIWYSRDFACLNQVRGGDEKVPWWKLYESLAPEDRAAAKSDDGLALGKFDPEWIKAVFRAEKLTASAYVGYGHQTEQEKQQRDAERKRRDRATSDSKIISTMVMRISKSPASTRIVTIKQGDREMMTGGRIPPELKLFDYRMAIDYKIDGEDGEMTVGGPNVPLPARSPEREAEIIKAAQDAAK